VIHPRKPTLFLAMAVACLYGGSAAADSSDNDEFSLRSVDATMTADEYRDTYRSNQHRIRRFIKSYSENTLMSLGIPRQGVRALGIIGAAAVTQDASFYLNSGKSMAIDIKDAAEDDRAVFFAIKHRW
jgi:hypothetical protein